MLPLHLKKVQQLCLDEHIILSELPLEAAIAKVYRGSNLRSYLLLVLARSPFADAAEGTGERRHQKAGNTADFAR